MTPTDWARTVLGDPFAGAELAERLPVVEARRALERRPVFLPVIGVPATRADCPVERPCPRVRCRHHLYLEQGRDRAGRRYGGEAPDTTLRAEWIKDPAPPSCALDVADATAARGEPPVMEVIASYLGLRPSQARELLAGALAKLRAAGGLDEDGAV